MRLLLTNDDGYDARGLLIMAEKAAAAGHDVFIAAPKENQSAVSHKINLHGAVEYGVFPYGGFAGVWVDGTPADCVKAAVTLFMEEKPDLVISGINNGLNTGKNILYSGTVAAALEAAANGVPAAALSAEDGGGYEGAADIMLRLIERGITDLIPPYGVLNINYVHPFRGIKLAPMGGNRWTDVYVHADENRIAVKGELTLLDETDTDNHLTESGYTTLTPLTIYRTDYSVLSDIKIPEDFCDV